MPIHINEHDGGNFPTVHVTGILSQADYERFAPKFEQFVRQHGKLRVLFDMTGFHGWEAAAIWEELKFDSKHLVDIERLAMVHLPQQQDSAIAGEGVPPEKSATTWRAPRSSKSSRCFGLAVGVLVPFQPAQNASQLG